mmetsp:Transcript_13072/g.54753  ORF Transcript_13072/g.54753 Transcript_13072/m.54753 type:complete len:290 (+) Transcript_13072:4338-5207(+)
MLYLSVHTGSNRYQADPSQRRRCAFQFVMHACDCDTLRRCASATLWAGDGARGPLRILSSAVRSSPVPIDRLLSIGPAVASDISLWRRRQLRLRAIDGASTRWRALAAIVTRMVRFVPALAVALASAISVGKAGAWAAADTAAAVVIAIAVAVAASADDAAVGGTGIVAPAASVWRRVESLAAPHAEPAAVRPSIRTAVLEHEAFRVAVADALPAFILQVRIARTRPLRGARVGLDRVCGGCERRRLRAGDLLSRGQPGHVDGFGIFHALIGSLTADVGAADDDACGPA